MSRYYDNTPTTMNTFYETLTGNNIKKPVSDFTLTSSDDRDQNYFNHDLKQSPNRPHISNRHIDLNLNYKSQNKYPSLHLSETSTIDAIHEISNNHDLKYLARDSRGSPSTVDAIHEISNNHDLKYLARDSRASPSTIDAIHEIRNNHSKTSTSRSDTRTSQSDDCSSRFDIRSSPSNTRSTPSNTRSSPEYSENCPPYRRFDSGVSCFTSVITPVTGLTPQFSGCTGSVEFRMRRKNKTVTLQWEPFRGSLAATGISFLTVAQFITNTPPYSISIPIYMQYKGVGRMTNINIDPHGKSTNVRFYLNTDGSSTGTVVGDSFVIYGGAVTWIVD
jgi:hypothetical protein